MSGTTVGAKVQKWHVTIAALHALRCQTVNAVADPAEGESHVTQIA
jgi:hypothetical protein